MIEHSELIATKVTPDTKAILKEHADKRRVKVAWLMRFILLDWIDEQSAKKKRATK